MLLLLLACTPEPSPERPRLTQMPLRWVAGFDGDRWEDARAGLWWQLSLLGALPPPGAESALDVLAATPEVVRFTLDLSAVGLPDSARIEMEEAAADLATSDEVALFGGLDVGAWFLDTLYVPSVYYRATGACEGLGDWEASHLDGTEVLRYAVTQSMLTVGDRLVHFRSDPDAATDVAHVVVEGTGSLSAGDFTPLESETIDLMPNGQLRYAVYDLGGELQPWSLATASGQPGKCMWCHEDHLQRGSPANPSAPDYLDVTTWLSHVDAQTSAVAAHRASLATALVFDPPDAHVAGELFTETWLNPSARRLAREWQVDEAALLARAAALPTHHHPEYPEFGPLYARADADRLFVDWLPTLAGDPASPWFGWEGEFTPLDTSESAREPFGRIGRWEGFSCP